MDYGVQAGDLSEKVKKEVAVIGSPATLDEQTWPAIDAFSAIAGHLTLGGLIDNTDPANPVIYLPADLPATIPCGHVVFATVIAHNDDPYVAHLFTTTAEFLDPDGVSRGADSDTVSIPAGGTHTLATLEITLDKPGTWNVHAVLSD